MILFKANREDMAAAARVAANVRLNSVFLTGIHAMNRLGQGVSHSSLKLNAKISHKSFGHKVLDEKTLIVQIECRLELRREATGDHPEVDSKPDVDIDVVYSASYSLPEPPIPANFDKNAFDAFAKINGLYNCWPYLRQEIQTIAASMEFPFVLPTLRIEVNSASKNENGTQRVDEIPGSHTSKTKVPKKRNRKLK
jgi:hypothetical protein